MINSKTIINALIFLHFFTFSYFLTSLTWALEINAREAIVMDFETRTILYSKNSDQLMPPASMSKIMTLYMLFKKIKQGSLSLEDTFVVSGNAWRKGGPASGSSTMFLTPGERVTVENLIRGIVVQSGNDACIVVAEGIAGSEEAFSDSMTREARELGLINTTFRNSTGWPHSEHLSTAHDLGLLAIRIIRDFPEFYHYFGEREFTYNNIRQYNRNPLLSSYHGSDGLKTGHTIDAGYGLTASAERAGQRLVVVVNGLQNKKERKAEPSRLLDWGFREYKNYKLFDAGDEVEKAPVWLGKKPFVSLIIKDDVVITIPRRHRNGMKVSVRYKGPIPTPVAKGKIIGSLLIHVPEKKSIELPLVAGSDVMELGAIGRIQETIRYLLWGN